MLPTLQPLPASLALDARGTKAPVTGRSLTDPCVPHNRGTRPLEGDDMTRRMKALIASAALVFAGAAYADEQQRAPPAGREDAAGTTSKEISGRVVQASPSKLFLEHMGAVVEFTIAPDAQFSGGNVKSSGDLSEGQEVRASFTVENKTSNVVKRISVAGEAGSKVDLGGTPQPERPTPGLPGRPPGTSGETTTPGVTPPTK